MQYDTDSVNLPIHPQALYRFRGAIVLLSSFTPRDAKHIDSDYILLCTFGWRVFGKLSDDERRAVCEHISLNGPAVEPHYIPGERRFKIYYWTD